MGLPLWSRLGTSPHPSFIFVLWVTSLCIQYIASNGRMMDEWWIGRDLEGSCHIQIEVLSLHLPGGTEENHKKTSVRKAGAPAKIWTEHLLHTSLEPYHYISPSVLLDKNCTYRCLTYKKTPSLWPANELCRQSNRRLLAKLVPTFADRGRHVVNATDPPDR
jgi:hypothetical protein